MHNVLLAYRYTSRSDDHICRFCFSGEDFKKGTTLLKKGTHIGYVEAAILAGMGVAKVPVYRQPRIVLLTTGDEVVELGIPLPEV